MKVLFTFLSIARNTDMYLNASYKLANEILENTPHDVLITTNEVEFFEGITSERFNVRNNVPKDSVLAYKDNSEFNYNLKYLAFKDLPEGYDVIFYLDGDIKSLFWDDLSQERLTILMEKYDWVATRLDSVLINEVNQHKKIGGALFSHKINSYGVLNWEDTDPLLNSHLPSEHFLIFKYDKEKLKKFSDKWSELNSILQEQNGGYGSWGDGFEMGISAKYAGYDNKFDLSYGDLQTHFGFLFNGNKK
jgi:hypothetical protein